jgi:hypothetical protein
VQGWLRGGTRQNLRKRLVEWSTKTLKELQGPCDGGGKRYSVSRTRLREERAISWDWGKQTNALQFRYSQRSNDRNGTLTSVEEASRANLVAGNGQR